MRHQNAGNHLSRTSSHRTAMARNMAVSLIEHERIITTLQKARNLRPFVEKLVTLAKDPGLHHRRLAFARLRSDDAVRKLFDVLAPRFQTRPGGYLRILKLSKPRLGDAGQRALIEFVERTPKEEPAGETPAAPAAKAAKEPAQAPAKAPAKTAKASKAAKAT